MKVVTAVEEYEPKVGEVSVFLAGGITACWDWQSAVIEELSKFDNIDQLVVFSPRRKNFPIHDPNAAQEQIEWEHKYLHEVDIFSMYFTAGKSVQPICMFELGVHLTRAITFVNAKPYSVVISVEDGYLRAQDVLIQSELALGEDIVNQHADAASHAKLIYEDYLKCKQGNSIQ